MVSLLPYPCLDFLNFISIYYSLLYPIETPVVHYFISFLSITLVFTASLASNPNAKQSNKSVPIFCPHVQYQ